MGFKCGIVGLPNVGKSTLFNALTKAGIEAANYPFCTIEPNVGIVPVPDERLKNIAGIARSKEIIPTTVQFVDIAGLVAGASKGEGLGNKFLANIRETHAIAHVVRCFENDDVTHVSGKIDPIADIETINTELALADLETLEKALLKAHKEEKRGDKASKKKLEYLESAKAHLDQGHLLRTLDMDSEQKIFLKTLQFLTLKPTLYIANVADNGMKNNPLLERVIEQTKKENADFVAICASIEADIVELEPDEQQEFLASMQLSESGLHRVIRAGYHLLGLETFFTVGPKEARAWTMKHGTTAPEAAGTIHTDFEKGFIRAEVISYEHYLSYKGEQGAKEAGKWRLEGKDYIVQDGDIMLFRFNV